MIGARAVLARLAVVAAVALVVVGLAGVGTLLAPTGGGGIAPAAEQPEWQPANVDPQRLAAGGSADPSGDVGVVLIDRTHDNRFEKEDVVPLVGAIDAAGGEVRYTDSRSGLQSGLQDADVLVILDPTQRYDTRETRAIEQFVDDGGRVLIAGEPNRKYVSQSGFSASLATRRSNFGGVASAFGVTFGSEYVYDMETNDGNFKDVVVAPPPGSDADAVRGVDRVTMYTAATVTVNRGTVLLRTAPTAERGVEDGSRRYPVAVLAADGAVMAVGDTTFFGATYDAVADNELFLARIVEFMAAADHQPTEPDEATEAPPAP